MFMGAGPELHGYTEWGSRTPELPSRVLNEHGIFPTVFSELRKAAPDAEMGVLYEWDGIKYLVDTLALNHHAQAPDYNTHPTALCVITGGRVDSCRTNDFYGGRRLSYFILCQRGRGIRRRFLVIILLVLTFQSVTDLQYPVFIRRAGQDLRPER